MKLSKKIGYAMGDMGISISYFAVGFFFIYYLTDIVKMNPILAGIAFFLGKLWDSVNDPLMGIISDRTKSKYGRKRVYILFGCFPLALSFVLLWMIPTEAQVWVQFIMATVSLFLYATAYTIVVVPYMALVPVMTQDYDERTQITGLRAILSTVGTILGGAIALMLSSFTDESLGLQVVMIGFAIFTLFSLLIAAQSVKGVEANDNEQSAPLQSNFNTYKRLLKERNVIILLVLKFLGALATGTLTAALPYFAEHILGDQGLSTYGLTIYIGTSALFVMVWLKLTERYDKRHLLLVGNVLAALVLLTIGFFVTGYNSTLFYAGCFLLGLTMSAWLLIPYSLVPDLVDYYQFKTGERHESVFFGLWITIHQFGIAFAGLVLGAVLGSMGYSGDALVQTDSALFAVRSAFGLVPAIFLILAALVLQKYEITRNVYIKVRRDLEQGISIA